MTYFFWPETKGRSLEEIAEIFDGPRALPTEFEITERQMSKMAYEERIEERSV